MPQAFYSKMSLISGLELLISRINAEEMKEALALLQPLTDETAANFYKESFLIKEQTHALYLKACI